MIQAIHPKCQGVEMLCIYTDPGAIKQLFGGGTFRGPPTGSMEFYAGDVPTKDEIVFPKEHFVTYEESDAKWAVPLGFAKVVKRSIQPGDPLTITNNREEILVTVTFVGINYRADAMPVYRIDFEVLQYRLAA